MLHRAWGSVVLRIIFFILFFNINQAFSQNADTNTIKANIQLCVDSVVLSPKFSRRLADEMIVVSRKINYPWGIFMNTMIIGVIECNDGNYSTAIKLHEEALSYAKKYNFKQKESVVLANIAKDNMGLGNHEKAIELYHQAVKVAQEIKDTVQMAQALESMGETYNRMEFHAETVKYCSQAAELFILKNRHHSARLSYNNIGTSYMDVNNFDSAYKYIWLSKREWEKAYPGLELPADFYLNMAVVYDSLGKKDSAVIFYKNALAAAREDENESVMQAVLYNLAEVANKKGRTAEAIGYYKEALALTTKYNNLEGTIAITSDLSQLFAKTGDYANAYRYSVLYNTASDSLLDKNKIEAIAALNSKFERQQLQNEFERKELLTKTANEKKIAKRNNLLYTAISVATLLLISIVFLIKYFRQRNIINQNRNNELKQKLLLTQMNPHFIFNSVDNIQSLIHHQKDEEAISYLTKFSKLTRQILENSRENHITLEEELSMLDNYITIQKLLYSRDFVHEVKVDDPIDPEAILLPPMLTQPFIENAIKHGLKDKNAGGLIRVRFYMNDEKLFFEVTDNGAGLGEKSTAEDHRSLSTQITRERLESLAPKEQIVIHTSDIKNEEGLITGVKTFFEIPFIANI